MYSHCLNKNSCCTSRSWGCELNPCELESWCYTSTATLCRSKRLAPRSFDVWMWLNASLFHIPGIWNSMKWCISYNWYPCWYQDCRFFLTMKCWVFFVFVCVCVRLCVCFNGFFTSKNTTSLRTGDPNSCQPSGACSPLWQARCF